MNADPEFQAKLNDVNDPNAGLKTLDAGGLDASGGGTSWLRRFRTRVDSFNNTKFARKIDAFSNHEFVQNAQLSIGGIQAAVGLVQTGLTLNNLMKHRDELSDETLTLGYIGVGFGFAGSIFGLATTANRIAAKTLGLTDEGLGAAGAALGITGKKARNTARFISGVGSALAVAAGAFSMATNIMAAEDAADAGNDAQVAYYSVQAALDGVGIILDAASFVLDFVFPPGAFLLDIVATMLAGVQAILSMFVPPPNAQQIFNALVKSDAF